MEQKTPIPKNKISKVKKETSFIITSSKSDPFHKCFTEMYLALEDIASKYKKEGVEFAIKHERFYEERKKRMHIASNEVIGTQKLEIKPLKQ